MFGLFARYLRGMDAQIPERVGGGPRLAAAILDYVFQSSAALWAAWNGMGWSRALEVLPGSSDLLELYGPMEENLTAAGLENGVEGLLGTMAMMGILYPMVEGLTGASPGKWLLGLRVANADGQPGGLPLYMKRFSIKFIRPLLIAMGALSGVSALGWMSGPAGLVISLGTLMLLAPHRQALHDKLALTAVFEKSTLSQPS